MAFLLFIILSASSLLLSKLNSSIKQSVYGPASSIAMEEARDAIISWAVNHPFNPGTIPMPDRNGDGDYDGDADCFNGTINNNLLLGRVPWRGMPSPCKDAASLSGLSLFATDNSGEQLWYAVSKNLVYESPDYPFISPGLLEKATDWITVRDRNGNIISDRVAFLIIAPGATLFGYADCDGLSYAGQDRVGTAPNVENYLDEVTISGTTYKNYDYDQDFIIYPNSRVTSDNSTLESCDQFNDQVVFVTIDEFIEEVSRRVLNETGYALSTYYNTNGALPWLVPFADPKSDPVILTGQSTSTSSNLVDSAVDFTDWGVSVGDVVWNITDGSRGLVTSVSANTLTLGGGMAFGANNSFTNDDEYLVEIVNLASTLASAATSGSLDLILEDTSRDFIELGITPGDILENLTDSSSGIVSEVDIDELTVSSLSGGTDNDFDSGDSYRIRSNTSQITANTDANDLTLEDTNMNFTLMGVQVNDLVYNITDGSVGLVTAVNSTTQLTVGVLNFGANNTFSQNDYYSISKYNDLDNTKIGLLPIHRRGETFLSEYNIDWSISTGGVVATTQAGVTLDTIYMNSMSTMATASAQYPGAISVADTQSLCNWKVSTIADCRGMFTSDLTQLFNGQILAVLTSDRIEDSGEDFPSKGVKRGDKITNLTDGTEGIIRTTYTTNTDELQISDITGETAFGMAVSNDYKIEIATATITGFPSAPTVASVYRMYDAGADFTDVEVGDIIENLNWTAIGRITAVNAAASPPYVDFTPLTDGTWPDFVTSEQFRIHYNFVDSREYEFDLQFSGNTRNTIVSGERKRDACIGYGSDCTSSASATALSGDAVTDVVTIRDYDNSLQLVATTTLKIPTTGSTGSILVSGLNFYLDESYGDLPDWFIRNKWHQYIMVAYSDGISPGGTACTPGTNCLSINIRDLNSNDGSSTVLDTRTDVRALVMMTNDQLSTQSWVNGAISDYFDDVSNLNIADDIFDKPLDSSAFNDLVRIYGSCDYPLNVSSNLCWSN